LQNSYLRLKGEPGTSQFHPVLKNLEDAYRIINGTHRVNVTAKGEFPSPVTLVPTYPDLPMEDVYPRTGDTAVRELYLREVDNGRVAYFNGDIDRAFWQIMCVDHGTLLKNTIRWALNEEPFVSLKSPGVIDVTTWRQEKSLTLHVVNLTNPMMMKGPFREFIPVDAEVQIRLPSNIKVKGMKLLLRGQVISHKIEGGIMSISIPKIEDHEIVGIDLA